MTPTRSTPTRSAPSRATSKRDTSPSTEAAEPLLAFTHDSVAGAVTVLVSPEDGLVRAAGYGGIDRVVTLIPPAQAHRGWAWAQPEDPAVAPVLAALKAYDDGDTGALDRVPVSQPGTVLMQAVWVALRGVVPGEPVTYARLAELAGSPRAIRAAASACARNRIAPFIPCHRAVRAGGGLGGYAYGLPIKQALLDWEARRP